MQRSQRTPLTLSVALAITAMRSRTRDLVQPYLAVGEPDEERVVGRTHDRRARAVRELGEERSDLERRHRVEARASARRR